MLISPDFMASDYCYGKEMQHALDRHKAGTCRVVPILLRPTYWEETPFSNIQLLPTDARPITRWPDQDEAFQNVVTEISRMIKNLFVLHKIEENWLDKDLAPGDVRHNGEALTTFEQAIRLDFYAPGFYADL